MRAPNARGSIEKLAGRESEDAGQASAGRCPGRRRPTPLTTSCACRQSVCPATVVRAERRTRRRCRRRPRRPVRDRRRRADVVAVADARRRRSRRGGRSRRAAAVVTVGRAGVARLAGIERRRCRTRRSNVEGELELATARAVERRDLDQVGGPARRDEARRRLESETHVVAARDLEERRGAATRVDGEHGVVVAAGACRRTPCR